MITHEDFYWVIGIMTAAIASILGVIFNKANKNSEAISTHTAMLKLLSSIPAKLEKHEEREDIVLVEINKSLTEIKVDLATLTERARHINTEDRTK